jgi:hypothetical protein
MSESTLGAGATDANQEFNGSGSNLYSQLVGLLSQVIEP